MRPAHHEDSGTGLLPRQAADCAVIFKTEAPGAAEAGPKPALPILSRVRLKSWRGTGWRESPTCDLCVVPAVPWALGPQGLGTGALPG